MKPRVLFLVTEDWYFCLHWLRFARAVRDAGALVLVATRISDKSRAIRDEGFTLLPIGLRRQSRQPLHEFTSLLELIRLYRRVQPDIVHHIALKPMLYGSIAAWITKIPGVVNAFAGLGYLFAPQNWSAKCCRVILGPVFRWAFALSRSRVIFQNRDDCDRLIREGIVKETQAMVIRGVGVDISEFKPSPEKDGVTVVLLASRMLWVKGVGEFVEAAQLLKKKDIRVRCVLAGRVDDESPSHISEGQLRTWQDEGVVEWWGHREDMPGVFALAHIVVLPSYHEGLPTVLLEAASCGKPIVATDIPGCRDVVRNGENGFLVPPKDPQALAHAIEVLVQDHALRTRMGMCGRNRVIQEFSSTRVAEETLGVYRTLLGDRWPTVARKHMM